MHACPGPACVRWAGGRGAKLPTPEKPKQRRGRAAPRNTREAIHAPSTMLPNVAGMNSWGIHPGVLLGAARSPILSCPPRHSVRPRRARRRSCSITTAAKRADHYHRRKGRARGTTREGVCSRRGGGAHSAVGQWPVLSQRMTASSPAHQRFDVSLMYRDTSTQCEISSDATAFYHHPHPTTARHPRPLRALWATAHPGVGKHALLRCT